MEKKRDFLDDIIGPYIKLIRFNPPFVLLFVATFISGIGTFFTITGMMLQVENQLRGEDWVSTAVFIMFLTSFAPYFLMMPFTGVVSDLFDKRVLLVIFDSLRFFLVSLFFLSYFLGTTIPFFVSNFFIFCCSAFYATTYRSIIPFIVRKDDLPTCNSISLFASVISKMIGNTVGLLIFNYCGPLVNWGLDMLTYALSAFITLFLFCYKVEGPSCLSCCKNESRTEIEEKDVSINIGSGEEVANRWKDCICCKCLSGVCGFIVGIFKGVYYSLTNPYVLGLSTMKFFHGILWGALELLVLRISSICFPIGTEGAITYLAGKVIDTFSESLSPIVMNFILESLLKKKEGRFYRCVVVLSYLVRGFGYIVIGFSGNVYVYLCAHLFLGFGAGMFWNYSTILVQVYCRKDLMGRVFAIDIAGFAVGNIIGSGLCAMLIDWGGFYPLHVAFILLSYCFLMSVLYSVWFFACFGVKESDGGASEKKNGEEKRLLEVE